MTKTNRCDGIGLFVLLRMRVFVLALREMKLYNELIEAENGFTIQCREDFLMKKRVISLLLILALCLGLCACGSKLNEEQMALVCGTWYLGPYQEVEGYSGYFELKEDGTGSFVGKEAFTWTAKQDREDPAWLHLTFKTEAKEKYTFNIYTGDPHHTGGDLVRDKEEYGASYLKASTQIQNPWFADLLTSWYAVEEDAVSQSVVLNGDGTVKLDDKTYFWSNAQDWEYNENSVHLNIYDEQGAYGGISADIRTNGLYSFRVHDYESGWNREYYDHPMLELANSGSWESIDRFTMIDDYFSVSPWSETTTVADVEYAVKFDTKASQDELVINLLENDALRYVVHIFMDGEYPMATLTDQQSGAQTLYYNYNYGYDPENLDVLYFQTLNLVYRYANDYGVYTLETDEYLDDEEKLPYIYEKLVALGDYKQAQEFVDRFTIVPSMLTEVTQYNTDKLNNVSDSWLSRYGYDENGTMIWARGEDVVEMYGVYDTYDTQYFTYDEKGNIADVQIKWSDTIEALGTPIFDTMGKLVGMQVQEQSDEYTSVFTFDAEGRVIELYIPEPASSYDITFAYTYDDAGKLASKVKTYGYNGNYSVITTYAYNGDVLVEKQEQWSEYGDEWTVTYTFTNDEQGRPLSAAITTTDPDVTYKSQEVQYTYEDLYFFDDTGLVLEEE